MPSQVQQLQLGLSKFLSTNLPSSLQESLSLKSYMTLANALLHVKGLRKSPYNIQALYFLYKCSALVGMTFKRALKNIMCLSSIPITMFVIATLESQWINPLIIYSSLSKPSPEPGLQYLVVSYYPPLRLKLFPSCSWGPRSQWLQKETTQKACMLLKLLSSEVQNLF